MDLEKGQVVYLKSNPEKFGPIIDILPGTPEVRYKVFLANGETQLFYASQVQKKEPTPEYTVMHLNHFHAYMTALQILHPGRLNLFSLNTARVDFIPYQFRPVLKFIRSDRPRLLIADGVGVGKTIEAGLILRELQSRSDVQSILIICPRPLVSEKKWEIEMKRFDEHFIPLDGNLLRNCIDETDLDGVLPEQYKKIIIPYSLFDNDLLNGTQPGGNSKKRRKGLNKLDPPVHFDLVIVDEAHHIRNPETSTHKVVRYFCENADAILFLTATPLQLGSQDLFVLLNLLRPDLIIDRNSFEYMAEPNPFINRAVEILRSPQPGRLEEVKLNLEKAVKTKWGQNILQNNPEFKRVLNELSGGKLDSAVRVEMIKMIENFHSFACIINRTRRRDIKDFTIRQPETIRVEFTPDQKKLYDSLLRVEEKILRRLHENANVAFMMTTLQRQVASCVFGIVPLLDNILNRRMEELEGLWEDEEEENQIGLKDEVLDSIKQEIQEVVELAKSIKPIDPKLDKLTYILREKQKLPNNKAMIFSTFRHTLFYLERNLKKEGFRVGLVFGDTKDEERRALREYFKLDRDDKQALDVLLFSEVGCEGLDYQFCDCIVNYDLPWNPMRIEQRIGRIDRIGQKSAKVVIYNLITPGTIDADIYDRCLLRIGIFNRAVGGSEEILGEISNELKKIGADFTLSQTQRLEKLQQLADNKIRLAQEEEALEEKQCELFGIKIPNDFEKEVEEASSFWLKPNALQNLVSSYIKVRGKTEQDPILGEKDLKTLRLSREARNLLLKDFESLSRQASYRDWENWLKGDQPHVSITFVAEYATQDPRVFFITSLHPLVRQAANHFNLNRGGLIALKIKDNAIPAGNYKFAIYQWEFIGIRKDVTLKIISESAVLNTQLTRFLEIAEEIIINETELSNTQAFEDLESQHHKIWESARLNHQSQNRDLVQYRKESLNASHQARIILLKESLSQAIDENIRRMRISQIANIEADYNRRVKDLDSLIDRADILARPVAFGIIKIEK